MSKSSSNHTRYVDKYTTPNAKFPEVKEVKTKPLMTPEEWKQFCKLRRK